MLVYFLQRLDKKLVCRLKRRRLQSNILLYLPAWLQMTYIFTLTYLYYVFRANYLNKFKLEQNMIMLNEKIIFNPHRSGTDLRHHNLTSEYVRF